MKNEEVKPEQVKEVKQEEDLILETGEEWDEEEGFIDYHENVSTAYNALAAVELINVMDKDSKELVGDIRVIALRMIHDNLLKIQEQFDQAHE